jgi:hypothetical protein
MRSLARVSLTALLACSGDLPRPPYVGQSTDALAIVQYPPPPGRVEYVPKSPAKGSVWIDGEWIWQGRRWAWKTGRWVMSPAGARFSPWTTVRSDDGTVYYAVGVWRDAQNRTVADPAALATAKATSGQVDDAEGQPETTGHVARESQVSESTDGGIAVDPGLDGGSG